MPSDYTEKKNEASGHVGCTVGEIEALPLNRHLYKVEGFQNLYYVAHCFFLLRARSSLCAFASVNTLQPPL